LTATLQLPPPSSTSPARVRGYAPSSRRAGTARSWWSRDRRLLRSVRRAAAFSAANLARDVASDALCRDRPPLPAIPGEAPGKVDHRRLPPDPASPPSRQGLRLPPDQGAFRRRDLPPLVPRRACAHPPAFASWGELPFRTTSLPPVRVVSRPHARDRSPRAPRLILHARCACAPLSPMNRRG